VAAAEQHAEEIEGLETEREEAWEALEAAVGTRQAAIVAAAEATKATEVQRAATTKEISVLQAELERWQQSDMAPAAEHGADSAKQLLLELGGAQRQTGQLENAQRQMEALAAQLRGEVQPPAAAEEWTVAWTELESTALALLSDKQAAELRLDDRDQAHAETRAELERLQVEQKHPAVSEAVEVATSPRSPSSPEMRLSRQHEIACELAEVHLTAAAALREAGGGSEAAELDAAVEQMLLLVGQLGGLQNRVRAEQMAALAAQVGGQGLAQADVQADPSWRGAWGQLRELVLALQAANEAAGNDLCQEEGAHAEAQEALAAAEAETARLAVAVEELKATGAAAVAEAGQRQGALADELEAEEAEVARLGGEMAGLRTELADLRETVQKAEIPSREATQEATRRVEAAEERQTAAEAEVSEANQRLQKVIEVMSCRPRCMTPRCMGPCTA
jgi:hypothetical protein